MRQDVKFHFWFNTKLSGLVTLHLYVKRLVDLVYLKINNTVSSSICTGHTEDWNLSHPRHHLSKTEADVRHNTELFNPYFSHDVRGSTLKTDMDCFSSGWNFKCCIQTGCNELTYWEPTKTKHWCNRRIWITFMPHCVEEIRILIFVWGNIKLELNFAFMTFTCPLMNGP